ncbi:uncharacterized protein CIMG_01138 [Coccidioides immitis RS]|uniref:Uncharacterized protein n=1 Tax=Coccidioides immitis (strain RS) TaxID=246410 RepID=J3KII6_COCIM|nr:uncharacterized protein CIMG_01138 [Coccidioides immitis RS]EAS35784.3 hypothetical protein CIMG_01138 [Coccidioides immitis RS]
MIFGRVRLLDSREELIFAFALPSFRKRRSTTGDYFWTLLRARGFWRLLRGLRERAYSRGDLDLNSGVRSRYGSIPFPAFITNPQRGGGTRLSYASSISIHYVVWHGPN